MKTVKNIEELRSLAAERGASVQIGAEVFNAERQRFKLRHARKPEPKTAVIAPAPTQPQTPTPVTVVVPDPQPQPALMMLARDMAAAVREQAESNTVLANVIADRPNRWVFEIKRDSSGAMKSVTAVGEQPDDEDDSYLADI